MIAKLQKLVSLLGVVEPRRKLYTIVYLLQQAGEDFNYNYDYREQGIVSGGLVIDLLSAENEKLLRVEKIGISKGHTITCPDAGNGSITLAENGSITLAENGSITLVETARKLGEMPWGTLEVLGAIVYLSWYKDDRLEIKLWEILPHLSRNFEEARIAAKELGYEA